jgi:uncharacterized membrane protein YkvA (DUF1232 family)
MATGERKGRRACPACGRALGSNAGCLSCREAAAQELAREAEDVTPRDVREQAGAVDRFLERPPWYAKIGPAGLFEKLRLLGMILRDYWDGSYRQMPWTAVAAVVAAVVYVISPLDLIPDFLVPIGWTDDMLVVAIAWGFVKRELRDYCEWKKLSPAHFGL